ncbi:MAG: DUF262 domain-containing HNH endonuclease family protein [Neisseria sp.]|nr:DUF262 domain-containing HNH endonuclease family protein [Neisseria sp.]
MSTAKNVVRAKTLYDLCNEHFIIPIYQRNYAWGEAQIVQLIEDIAAACKEKKQRYYLGSLIVFARDADGKKEVIDGQQRLTTLALLLSCLKETSNIQLTFEHRATSQQILAKLQQSPKQLGNSTLEQGYQIIEQALRKLENEGEFKDFLLNKVQIIYTEVPPATDLNHYFEIMNNRGEQLEKHEIIKARLMSSLKEAKKEEENEDKKECNERTLFAMIWNACADMNGFVIEHFSGEQRKTFFGENAQKIPTDFDGLCRSNNMQNHTKRSISDLLKSPTASDATEQDTQDKISEPLSSIMDFPNFLMLALKLYQSGENHIPLDDKKLLEQFGIYEKAADFAKTFIMHLLQTRLLFDRFIIKSDAEHDWQLRGIKRYAKGNYSNLPSFGQALNNMDYSEKAETNDEQEAEQNENLQIFIMHILSMFHVSFKARTNKTWLFDVLKHIQNLAKYQNFAEYQKVQANDYLRFLEKLAVQYYKGRASKNALNAGTATPHYLFHFWDYVLWQTMNETEWAKIKGYGLSKHTFRFSMANNSIEHYFPQSDESKLKNKDLLNDFGNLCLIPHHQNSSLSDKDPARKKLSYTSTEGKHRLKAYSIKQLLMFAAGEWNEDAITGHGKEMQDKINKFYQRVGFENRVADGITQPTLPSDCENS